MVPGRILLGEMLRDRLVVLLAVPAAGCCYVFGSGDPQPTTETVRVDCFTAKDWLEDGEVTAEECAELCERSGLVDVDVTRCEQLSDCTEEPSETGGYSMAVEVVCDGMRQAGECR